MARKQTPQGRVKQVWIAESRDAISIAALHWYAITIEKVCIEIYATDRKRFKALEALLQSQVRDLYKFAKGVKGDEDDECPEGYVMCNGLCAPACDFE
jgi:hypothetical protein